MRCVAWTAAGSLSCLAAYVGGVVAQEVLKALTGKFMPIRQWFLVNGVEVLPKALLENPAAYEPLPAEGPSSMSQQRALLNYICLGKCMRAIFITLNS